MEAMKADIILVQRSVKGVDKGPYFEGKLEHLMSCIVEQEKMSQEQEILSQGLKNDIQKLKNNEK